jgi:large subunit ribosomal protein L15
MLQLNNLESLVKNRKRRGRGGSRGGTSGRGHKGQLARSGGRSAVSPVFEGGQMPLTRRLPRRGFTNRNHKFFKLISLNELERCFNGGDVVNEQVLREQGLVKGKKQPLLKVVSNGSLSKALTVTVNAVTASARKHIEEAGGSVQLVKEMSGDSTAS